MSKIVTFPREKHASGKQMTVEQMQTGQDREIFARILLENVARWIADPDRDEIINMDVDRVVSPRLTPEQVEEMDKSGAGSFGHTTVIEPADLDLYESYMYPPLAMPEKPEVMVSYWDMNNKIPFLEGRVMVKALCPDGVESLAGDQRAGAELLHGAGGQLLGLAEVRLRRDDGGEGTLRGHLRGQGPPVDGLLARRRRRCHHSAAEGAGARKAATPSRSTSDGGGMCLIRQGRPGGRGRQETHFAEWEPGMIRTWMRPEDPWAGLIPEDCVTPGVWATVVRPWRRRGRRHVQGQATRLT